MTVVVVTFLYGGVSWHEVAITVSMPISSQLEDTRVIKQTGIGVVIVSVTAVEVARKVVECFARCVRWCKTQADEAWKTLMVV